MRPESNLQRFVLQPKTIVFDMSFWNCLKDHCFDDPWISIYLKTTGIYTYFLLEHNLRGRFGCRGRRGGSRASSFQTPLQHASAASIHMIWMWFDACQFTRALVASDGIFVCGMLHRLIKIMSESAVYLFHYGIYVENVLMSTGREF